MTTQIDNILPPTEKCSYQVGDGSITEYDLGHNWTWKRGSGFAIQFARHELGKEFKGTAHVTIKLQSSGEERTYKVKGWLEHKTSGREVVNKRVLNILKLVEEGDL